MSEGSFLHDERFRVAGWGEFLYKASKSTALWNDYGL
jgi:hypothetical protein